VSTTIYLYIKLFLRTDTALLRSAQNYNPLPLLACPKSKHSKRPAQTLPSILAVKISLPELENDEI
jgi:hypothetical protein